MKVEGLRTCVKSTELSINDSVTAWIASQVAGLCFLTEVVWDAIAEPGLQTNVNVYGRYRLVDIS